MANNFKRSTNQDDNLRDRIKAKNPRSISNSCLAEPIKKLKDGGISDSKKGEYICVSKLKNLGKDPTTKEILEKKFEDNRTQKKYICPKNKISDNQVSRTLRNGQPENDKTSQPIVNELKNLNKGNLQIKPTATGKKVKRSYGKKRNKNPEDEARGEAKSKSKNVNIIEAKSETRGKHTRKVRSKVSDFEMDNDRNLKVTYKDDVLIGEQRARGGGDEPSNIALCACCGCSPCQCEQKASKTKVGMEGRDDENDKSVRDDRDGKDDIVGRNGNGVRDGRKSKDGMNGKKGREDKSGSTEGKNVKISKESGDIGEDKEIRDGTNGKKDMSGREDKNNKKGQGGTEVRDGQEGIISGKNSRDDKKSTVGKDGNDINEGKDGKDGIKSEAIESGNKNKESTVGKDSNDIGEGRNGKDGIKSEAIESGNKNKESTVGKDSNDIGEGRNGKDGIKSEAIESGNKNGKSTVGKDSNDIGEGRNGKGGRKSKLHENSNKNKNPVENIRSKDNTDGRKEQHKNNVGGLIGEKERTSSFKEKNKTSWTPDETNSCDCLPGLCTCTGGHYIFKEAAKAKLQEERRQLQERKDLEKQEAKTYREYYKTHKEELLPSCSCQCISDDESMHYMSLASISSAEDRKQIFHKESVFKQSLTAREQLLCFLDTRYERTLAMIKPEGMPFKDAILRAIEHEGLSIINKRTLHLSPEQVSELYSQHYGTSLFPIEVVKTSMAPVMVLSLAGIDAFNRWKNLIGPDRVLPQEWFYPFSIKSQYGLHGDIPESLHASQNLMEAMTENRYYFPESLIEPIISDKSKVFDYCQTFINPTLRLGLAAVIQAKPSDPVVFLAEWLLMNNPFQPRFPKNIAEALG